MKTPFRLSLSVWSSSLLFLWTVYIFFWMQMMVNPSKSSNKYKYNSIWVFFLLDTICLSINWKRHLFRRRGCMLMKQPRWKTEFELWSLLIIDFEVLWIRTTCPSVTISTRTPWNTCKTMWGIWITKYSCQSTRLTLSMPCCSSAETHLGISSSISHMIQRQ